MSRTPKALVEGSVLKWARTSIGHDMATAAKKIGIAPGRLAAWEVGAESPTVAQLRQMANVYKRPLAVFYLPEPPRGFDALRDFRKLPSSAEREWSPELHLAFRRATEQRAAALELKDLVADETQTDRWQLVGLDGTEDPDALGGRVRDALGISVTEQTGWKGDRYAALNRWIGAIEETGVLVLQSERVPLDEMRGFSIFEEQTPVIVVNGSDAPRGKIFSLLHEYSHLALRNGGLCDQAPEKQPASANRKLEVLCNQIAASTLVPRDDLLAQPAVASAPTDFEGWTSAALESLANRYTVSEESLIRRLVSVGKATVRYYERRRAELQRLYGDRLDADGAQPGQPPYYRLKLRNLGRSYVRLVLHAYDRELIDTAEAASFLSVKVDGVSKLAKLLTSPSRA